MKVTNRELVHELTRQGKTANEIAEEIGISGGVVRAYRRAMEDYKRSKKTKTFVKKSLADEWDKTVAMILREGK